MSDKTPREIAQMADALNTMAARIETQLADQRALLAAVSHEVRTPLGHLRLLVETGQDLGPDHTRLDAMALELDAMETLVARLLAHSRLEFESLTPAVLDARDHVRRGRRFGRCLPGHSDFRPGDRLGRLRGCRRSAARSSRSLIT